MLARELGVPYIKRNRSSLTELFAEYNHASAVIITKQDWRYEDHEGHVFFFHPSMSILRIKHILKGEPDSLIASAGIEPGDTVLDCTLGMGADAIVASFVTGEKGRVVGLESEPAIAAIVRHGLQTYDSKRKAVNEAMRRIEVIQTDYREYLKQCPDQSFDVIYFDPMFRQTIKESSAMQALKPLANHAPLDPESVAEARRVARKAVLLKERVMSGEFERLGFTVIKKAAHYAWGIITPEEGGK
ncbi:Putative SAM-dependent methyltransferase [Thermoflavimicrobium dichotomicum]|uniref:Putative SAM-dependent methyltransferase n=2 Tax=Thermoflavimicrobium dichotomicum TaxID=46223 RepID=A0A1I3RV23_9BACL|nr:Putative SAM-dependent methyltransferase [Thermoflavimicrobium dichotomicum]